MSETTLAPNQYADYGEFSVAMDTHRRKAESILDQLIGALGHIDRTGADSDAKARTLDSYTAKVREWDAARPEWVR